MWGSVCYCYSPKKCDLSRGISCNCVLVFIHVHLVFFLGLCQILTWWYRKRKRYIQTCSLYGYSKELILQCFVSSLWFLLKLHLTSRVKSQEWISLEWKIEKEKSLLGLQNPWLAESFSVNHFVKHQLQNRIWIWPMLITNFWHLGISMIIFCCQTGWFDKT